MRFTESTSAKGQRKGGAMMRASMILLLCLLVCLGAGAVEGGGSTPLSTIVRKGLAAGRAPDALDERGYTWLHHAAAAGDLLSMARLLEKGATVDSFSRKEGMTPLGYAAMYGRTGAVAYLLKRGADPKGRRDLLAWPPLYCAALSGDRESAALLVKAGARGDELLHSGTRPEFLLTLAMEKKDLRAVEILLDSGARADPTARLGDGSLSSLAMAVPLGDPHLLRRLLQCGADPNRGGPEGLMPLHMAAAANRGDLCALLLMHGARKKLRLGVLDPMLSIEVQGSMLLVRPKGAPKTTMPKILPALPKEVHGLSAYDLARRNGHEVVSELIYNWQPGREAPFVKTDGRLRQRVETLFTTGRALKRVHTGQAWGLGTMGSWPFRIQVGPMRGRKDAFEGWIEWTSLDSKHHIEGQILKKELRFRELSQIKKGKAALGATYRFPLTITKNPFPAHLRGTWSLGKERGSVQLTLIPEGSAKR